MSYDAEIEFRWFNENGAETLYIIDIQMRYNAAAGLLELLSIESVSADDSLGNRWDWRHVKRDFKPTLVDAMLVCITNYIDTDANNTDKLLHAHDDYIDSLADSYESPELDK
jgi:hypothetical protein